MELHQHVGSRGMLQQVRQRSSFGRQVLGHHVGPVWGRKLLEVPRPDVQIEAAVQRRTVQRIAQQERQRRQVALDDHV